LVHDSFLGLALNNARRAGVGPALFLCDGAEIIWRQMRAVILKAVMGLRVSEEAEVQGLDMAELGMEAYPEFTNR
jgi:Amt family ammonium transporter